MRSFVGLPLCDDAVQRLERVQEGLGTGRLVSSENLHVTLAFLDEQPTGLLEVLHDNLAVIPPAAPRLTFEGVEAKGGHKSKLVWATLLDDPGLLALHDKVRSAARQAGLDLRRERFRPHVTLARFGATRPAHQARLQAWLGQNGGFRAGPFVADRMCLYQSTLTPEGPIYEVMAEYPLV